jgi:hypothetical protein
MSYSQFGEDVFVDDLLGGPTHGVFVDVGAGDGMEISNSRLFREMGWWCVLVEPDQKYRMGLSQLSGDVSVYPFEATVENINRLVPESATVLSIDVDGDDYFLLDALERRPRAIIIEHNPTIPYSMDVCPASPGLAVGASVAALERIAREKGYGLAGVTHCNAIFALGEPSIPMPDYKPAYAVATEYFTGRPFVCGEAPWGVRFEKPYPTQDLVIR